MNELDLKILHHLFPNGFDYGTHIHSPFRGDVHPDLTIYNDGNRITWYDFAYGSTKNKKYDCIELLRLTLEYKVKKKFTRSEARVFAQKNLFKLVIPKEVKLRSKKSYIKVSEPKILLKNYYDPWELKFWSDYEQTSEVLVRERIYGLAEFSYHPNYPMISNPESPKFIYLFGKEGWKMYAPFEDKKNKWRSGNLSNIIEGWNTLPETADELWIDASTKDRLCMLLVFEAVINPTGEGSFRTLLKFKSEIDRRFKKVYVCFDNDSSGRKYTKQLCKVSGWIPVYLDNYPMNRITNRPCKDKAELVYFYKKQGLIDLFKSNKIIL